ncbi:N-methyl-L-tryptophan oxidase [Salinicoccus cyprini]|uniref:N-methyl-L-tryptophan oxidase n=1 Tax=Salinicoccus cyprini TaxID=2493691 RepID=A0A558AT21_9STAP|nr:N-methyl-L-tryptophan oxidase [Salinicoccus cyprini]TVT27408.1 N-methyl-L-tryptophan oxidase [Salinicoccus cyprini]
MDADVGVIGLGTMGSMASWQLAKENVSVLGFEQFGIGHDRSAAGGETRLFRTAYKEGLSYIPLLKDAYKMWKELENETGNSLFQETSGLIIGNTQLESMKNVLEGIRQFDLEHEVLTMQEARERFPQHSLAPDEIMIVDKQSGYLRPQHAIFSAVQLAENLGAKILSHTPVENISPVKDGVLIRTKNKEYKVRKVLITAGPWSNQFSQEFDNHLEVRRLVNAWFLPKNQELFNEENFPVFTKEKKSNSYYGFPTVDGKMVKIGIFSTNRERILNANLLDKNVGIEELTSLKKIIEKELPELCSDPSRVNAYMECYTEDNNPIIGKTSGQKNVFILTGFSGHGFKMAPTMGKIAKELLLNQNSSFSLDIFSPKRFLSKCNTSQ